MAPTNPSNLLSETELRAMAPELSSYLNQFDSPTISGMLSQATQLVLGICNVKGFDRQQAIDEGDAQISNEGDLVITAEWFPILSASDIVQVALIKGGFTANLTLRDSLGNNLFQIPDPGWRFEFPNSYFYLTGTYLAGGSSQLLTLKGAHVKYQMTYNAGYYTIPAQLKQATLLMFRDIFKQTANPFGATSWRQGSMSQSFGMSKDGKSELYQLAEQILYKGNFVRVAQF